jgi:iron complex outermembrane receptor protein
VPIAVSAFTAAELEQRNVVQALDVLQYVPNVVASNNVGLGSANTYYIRGLGSTDSIATADPAVGTYVDDIYVGRQSANNLALFDVERVEVLRGPQGTLFGRNTTGGAVAIVLGRPAKEVGGYVEAGLGSFGRKAVRGSVDLPVADGLQTRASAYWNRDNGYVRNVTTGERLNNSENYGARLALQAQPTDALRWNFAGLYTYSTAANILNFDCNPAAPNDCEGRFASTGLLRNNSGANQVTPLTLANGKGNLPLGAETRFALVSSNVQLDLGGAELSAITGYVRTEQDFLVDFFDGRAAPTLNFGLDPATGLPTRFNVGTNVLLAPPVRGFRQGGFVIANIAKTDQFSQELKINGTGFGDRLTYVAGIFYFNERSVTDFADTLTPASGVPLLLADRIVRNKTEAIAGYGQVDVGLTDQVVATAGVRYTDERRQAAFSDNRAICQANPLPATCLDSRNFGSVDVDLNPLTPATAIPLLQSVKIWTPRFALNYRPNDDLLLFASATRGFKSGAQAARATAVRQLLPVGPEKVWSYELGAKSEFFDRRLRLNVTGFIQNTEDFQGGTAFVNPTTGALTFVTRNLADLANRGLEVELVARPIPALTLSLAGGYQNIRFQVDRDQPNIDALGFLSVAAQQAECRAALAGQASPLGFPGTTVVRAQGNCSGIINNRGDLARPVRSPELTASLTAAYRLPLVALGATLTPAVSVLYTSDQEVGTNNLSGYIDSSGRANFEGVGDFVLGSFSRGYSLVNLNLALASNDDRWTAILSCTNCGDRAYPQSTLSNFSYLNEPRTWAIDIRRRF